MKRAAHGLIAWGLFLYFLVAIVGAAAVGSVRNVLTAVLGAVVSLWLCWVGGRR